MSNLKMAIMKDHEEGQEDDLWFLPGPAEEEPLFLPSRATRPSEIETQRSRMAEWAVAEAGQAQALAALTWVLGQLDMRLACGPAGWRQRLAILEAEAISWTGGARLGQDRLAQWIAQRASSLDEDIQALARAAWMVRRLSGGPGPDADMAVFLARQDVDQAQPGDGLGDHLENWQAMIAQAHALHPVSRAAAGFAGWRLAGLERGQASQAEAATVAARMACPAGARGLVFVPLAFGGAGEGLRAIGTADERLARWIAGATTASRAALRHLDDLISWREAAQGMIAPMTGRTLPPLLSALEAWPLVSAPMAESLTGASRASVHRGLDRLVDLGLVREVTGQGRFRFWAAKLTGGHGWQQSPFGSR